uniref:MBG domain-containing protein n=1 Tax=mine drainage metagenome TaxID=410659 RepID=E6QIV0_9ZZZZ
MEFLPQSAGNSINEAITYSVSSGSGSRKTYSIPVSGVSENKISQNITFRVVSQVSYGQNSSTGPNSIQLVATSTSELAVQFSVLSGPGSIVPGSSILQVLGAGAIIIKASQAGNGEYGPAPDVVQTVNVMPALLTVTASSKQVTYGESIGSCEYTITGFVQGDSAATSVSGNPVISCGSGTLPSIGLYSIQISQGTLSSGNYQFIFVPGMLTVSPALLRVIPQNASNLYGDSIPSLSYSIAGFIGSDNVAVVSGSPVLTTSATRQSNVGSYPIQCSMGTLRAVNYSFICQSGTLLITPATLRIAPGAQSFVYGASVPALSYTISGLVNGDTASVIQGSPVLSTPATEHSSVGNYPILCNARTMHSLNYIVSCSSSAITVTKRVLSVNAVSPNVIYGSLMPEMKYSFSGFVNGDQSSNAIGGAPSAASSYLSESTVGTYPIIISSGTLSSVNYAFAFGRATLTVFPATLYLAPNDLTLLSGSSIPPLTYTAYGLINGETLATATTGSPSLTTTATSSSMPGKYPIIMLQGTLRSPNYTIICMNRTLTILSSSAQGNGGLNGGSPPPVPVHGKPLLPHTGGAVNEEKGYAVSSTPFAGITVWNGTGLTTDSAVTLTDDATSTSYTATTNSTDAGSLIHQNKFCDQMVSGLMLNIQKSLDVSMHDSDKENCSEVSGKSADKSNKDSTITER